MEEEASGLDGETLGTPVRRQRVAPLPAKRRRKGIAEIENDDDSGEKTRREGVGGVEHMGGVASQGAAMEQPIRSPQTAQGLDRRPGNPVQGRDEAVQPSNIKRNGSYHCELYKCDVCEHMLETTSVFSSHFQRRHAVAGNNVHLKATVKVKLRWFVYLHECFPPEGVFQYVGSTCHMTERWANTKSKCNDGKTEGSGMEKHFKMGCSANKTRSLENVRITLLEHYDTTTEKVKSANHKPGPACRCTECDNLKDLEDKWMFRLGTIFGQFGLNNRNEVTNKARARF